MAYADAFHQRQKCRDENHKDTETRQMANHIERDLKSLPDGATVREGAEPVHSALVAASSCDAARQFGCDQ